MTENAPNPSSGLRIVEADLHNPAHAAGMLEVLDSYASDPIGGGQALREDVRARLPVELAGWPHSLVLLAFAGERAVGVAICFGGFSTFAARPLLNLHDLAVLPDARGQGVGQALLRELEQRARAMGCCKLTLEVREDNTRAQALYQRLGFGDYAQGGRTIRTLFLEKKL